MQVYFPTFFRKTCFFALMFLVTLGTGCSSPSMKMKSIEVAGSAVQTAATPVYLIGPGDALSVFVWGNPELSADVIVRPDGYISTPLVEDVQASGKAPTDLAREMEAELSKLIKNPKVTVSLTTTVGQYSEQIRVVGQASTPRALPYRENMTLLDVIIAVGGLTEFAAGNKSIIVRNVGGKTEQYRVRLDDLIRDGDISANVKVVPGDVLIIPETWF